MTEEEIKLVAEVLANIGGNWYPERARSEPKPVTNRHREVARLIVGAVERSKAANQSATDVGSASDRSVEAQSPNGTEDDKLNVGAKVLYRPPGDKRTFPCRIEELEGGRAYVVPEHREIGWVSTHSLLPLNPNRDDGKRPPLSSIPTGSADGKDAQPEAPAPEGPRVKPARRPKSEEATAKVKYYFSSSGEWIAFRLSETDRYLFDKKGNWIGWFPWNDNDIVRIDGQYLGTVFYGNRIYRRASSAPSKRDPGFVMDPGDAQYVSHPGHAAPYAPPHGYKDVDMAQIPTSRRTWLKSRDKAANSGDPSTFEVWMSKIGLGFVARAIKGMVRS
ncbi:hypothetical protein [Microvirga sp. KLBC 81]|uniref:hypothetical protein n=1 Tax=Microvirga sp. KLBC 81 TaxID=1862707 RepID=UPI001057D868|nr:hypothetical protein [Microvirga sp. KLBC 81]